MHVCGDQQREQAAAPLQHTNGCLLRVKSVKLGHQRVGTKLSWTETGMTEPRLACTQRSASKTAQCLPQSSIGEHNITTNVRPSQPTCVMHHLIHRGKQVLKQVSTNAKEMCSLCQRLIGMSLLFVRNHRPLLSVTSTEPSPSTCLHTVCYICRHHRSSCSDECSCWTSSG